MHMRLVAGGQEHTNGPPQFFSAASPHLPTRFEYRLNSRGDMGSSWRSQFRTRNRLNLEHVEDDARLFRHPARVPGRVPDHADIDLSHSRHGRNCVCTITCSSCADGQVGEVSDMSTFTVRSSGMSML